MSITAQTMYTNAGLTTEGPVNYCGTDTGSGNAFVCANPTGAAISTYQAGRSFSFKSSHANTGAATLSVDGLTATPIKKSGGVSLIPGDIPSNSIATVTFDGTAFQLSSGGTSGYANVAPNYNTSTTSQIVVISDSHMAGAGQTTPIASQLHPTESYTVTNLAVSGTKFCAYWATPSEEATIDALYNSQARSNILVLEGGGNDMIDNNTGNPAVPYISAQQVYDCQKSFALRRKAVGWRVVLYGMYSRTQTGFNNESGDQLHDDLNTLYNNGWPSFADSYVDIAADPNVGKDGNYSNTTYFQADGIHVASSYTGTLAALLSTAIDRAAYAAERGVTYIHNDAVGAALNLSNGDTNDFNAISFTGDQHEYLLYSGNSGAPLNAGGFGLYDVTAGLSRMEINAAGNTTFFGTVTSTKIVGGTGDTPYNPFTTVNVLPSCSTAGCAGNLLLENYGNATYWLSAGVNSLQFAAQGTDGFLWKNNVAFNGDPNATGTTIASMDGNGNMTVNGLGLTSQSSAACDNTHGGTFNYVHVNGTTKDTVQVCAQDAGGTYAWRAIY